MKPSISHFAIQDVLITILFLCICLGISSQTVSALSMTGPELIIEVDDLLLPEEGIDQQEKQSASIVNGYDNEASTIGMSLSDSSLLFDPLIPTNPLIRSNTLLISAKGHTGYTIYTRLKNSFLSPSGGTIPDTSCDDGSCTQKNSASWENTLTYGFGYRCENNESHICDPTFDTSKNSFMRFASQKAMEPFSQLLNIHTPKTTNTKIIYKMNISGTQTPAIYETTIQFILMPEI